MKKHLLGAVAGAVAVLMIMGLVSGCGSSNNNSSATTPAATTPAATTPAATTPAATTPAATTAAAATTPAATTPAATTAAATSTAASTAAATTVAATGAQLKPVPISDTTPCTITIGGITDTTTNTDFAATPTGKQITQLTGITIKLETIDVTKMTTLAAAGSLPDILYMNNDSTGQVAKALASSGNLLAIDNLLKSNGQNILARASDGIAQLAKQTNNVTYCLPCAVTTLNTTTPSYNGSNGFYVRYDLYQGIGSPAISGADSFLNVLKQMQTKYPTAPDGSKAYALSAWTDWGLWPYYYMYPYMVGYDVLEGQQFVNRYTGEWTSSFMDPQSIFWQNVYFYYKANQLGIFDPDGLTQTWAQLGTKIGAGNVYTCCAGNWSVPDQSVCGANAGLFMLPGSFPVCWQMYTPSNPIGYGFNDSRCISANCKNPTRAMDFLNFCDSDYGSRLLMNGVEGTDWAYDSSGNPLPIGQYLDGLTTGSSTYATGAGIQLIQYMTSCDPWTTSDGFANNITMTAPWYNVMAKANTAAVNFVNANNGGDTSITYPGQVYASWEKQGNMLNNNDFPWPSFQSYMTQSTALGQAETQAEQYITGELGNLILAKDQAAFNAEQTKVINALTAQGLPTAEKEIATQWSAAKSALQSQVTGSTTPPSSGLDISQMNPSTWTAGQ